jgi:hypothetical protein
MKIVVYSCNINHYDFVKEPYPVDKRSQYILFTDVKDTYEVWEAKYIDYKYISPDPQRASRYFKLNPHKVLPEHDISVWVDFSFIIRIPNLVTFVKSTLGTNNIACYTHGCSSLRRNCIYQEADVCCSVLLDDVMTMKSQMAKYKAEGFPKKYGLFSTGLIIRKNNKLVNEFNETWWNEICKGSKRDQLSQMYAAWKCDLNIAPIKIGTSIYENDFLIKQKHKVRRRKIK